MPHQKNVFGAMFDVRPIDSSGRLLLERIQSVKSQINLKQPLSAVQKNEKRVSIDSARTSFGIRLQKKSPHLVPPVASKEYLVSEFQRALTEPADIVDILASVGGQLSYQTRLTDENIPLSVSAMHAVPDQGITIFKGRSTLEDFWTNTEPHDVVPMISGREFSLPQKRPAHVPAPDLRPSLRSAMSPASREMHRVLQASLPSAPIPARSIPASTVSAPKNILWEQVARPTTQQKTHSHDFFRRWGLSVAVFMGLIIFFTWLSYSRAVAVRHNVFQNSTNAVANLEKAKDDLEQYHFGNAADSFALAHDDLNKASGTLDNIGASLLSVFGSLPGLSKIAAAHNVVQAGQYLARSGEYIARASQTLFDADISKYIQYNDHIRQKSLGQLAHDVQAVLQYANTNVTNAGQLLADVDQSLIPPDKRVLFAAFQNKFPDFQHHAASALDLGHFLAGFVGSVGHDKTYLVLFQNNSELRATGGFPGSYAVVRFHDGYLNGINLDDIYNPDGQLKEKIIPPEPLQHITPSWGMRDANWFADFPTSARKIETFYEKDGGPHVDGVITVTPDVILDILDIVGPIAMPEYGLQLTSKNFMAQIQAEIEYGDNRTQPKTILKDLQPKLLAAINAQGKDSLVKIFNALALRLAQKHILGYFNNPSLEKIAQQHGFAGELKTTPGDFVEVAYTNVKGSKTDAFTDNELHVSTRLDKATIYHTLTIDRTHRGGDQADRFYNLPNPAYVRVYVPRGAHIESINGQDDTHFKSIVTYSDDSLGYVRDNDLAMIENGIDHPLPDVDVFEETGKTVFGFWMITQPHNSSSVMIRYSLPRSETKGYTLLWQKQSGTPGDKAYASFVGSGALNTSDADLKKTENGLLWNGDLTLDHEFHIIDHE